MAPSISARPRSTFVSVVAWVFIILSGFATLISLLQNLMTIGFAALFGWIIAKLLSRPIREEFGVS